MSEAINDTSAIRRIVEAINAAWLSKRYEAIGEYLAERVVLAPPGSAERIHGRSAYVASYRQYDEVANTIRFTSAEPQIDVVGDVAVATCPFAIEYEFEAEIHRERGLDILVFGRQTGQWQVLWRSMDTRPEQ